MDFSIQRLLNFALQCTTSNSWCVGIENTAFTGHHTYENPAASIFSLIFLAISQFIPQFHSSKSKREFPHACLCFSKKNHNCWGMTVSWLNFTNMLAVWKWIKWQRPRQYLHKEKGQRLILFHYVENINGVQPPFYKYVTNAHWGWREPCKEVMRKVDHGY